MFRWTEEPLSWERLHLRSLQSGKLWQKTSSFVMSLLTCDWLFGIWKNLRYVDNLCSHWQISVLRLGKHTSVHTRAHNGNSQRHTLARLGCHHQLVSVPHLWMVTRPRGLQHSHSCLTDSRDQFPPAERASGMGEVCLGFQARSTLKFKMKTYTQQELY